MEGGREVSRVGGKRIEDTMYLPFTTTHHCSHFINSAIHSQAWECLVRGQNNTLSLTRHPHACECIVEVDEVRTVIKLKWEADITSIASGT